MSDSKESKSNTKDTKSTAKVERTPFVNPTPAGQMKDFSNKMADAYHPQEVEASWDKWWETQGLYAPDDNSDAEKFVMVIPPPNVTGTLHIGHALTCSVEDAIVRWNRMSGKNTLWVPGTDHAGIATQVVVEKKLMREQGKTRHDLGREQFIEEVWKWKETNGNQICNQLRRLGASVDWSREAFTMSPQLCVAVEEAFVRLHSKGLIYRENRLVNWSCTLRTAISAIEVEYMELDGPTMLKVPTYTKPIEFGVIHSFAYPLVDGSGELVVATTRIETMLGDVAVAVHPSDERYKQFHGKKLRHPFVPDREVIVIADGELVDPKFGTGAVKVTPAHDPNDFKCGQRHKLPFINIFTDDGCINSNGGSFAGTKRFDCRETIIAELTNLGLYRGKGPNKMSLGMCSRSKDVIEPVLRPQWYVNCQTMAARAVDAVRTSQLNIMPESEKNTWYRWLENIQDWCISRQLWWGHRIPAYHVTIDGEASVDDQNHWVVAHSIEDARKQAEERFPGKSIQLTQDPDVLDTWFSSGLFPFSVLGWPNQTKDMEKYYPGTLLETGYDILFFWVARMVMMGLELTDQLPFTLVYLHAMVRDKFGRKMSKSLGNVVDPIDVIEGINLEELHEKLRTGNLDPAEVEKAIEGQKRDFPQGIAECGADALRFGLLAYSSQGTNVNLDIQRVVAYRQFGNKLWQATRFALLNFDANFKKPASLQEVHSMVKSHGSLADRWILHRLNMAVELCDAAFTKYEFGGATTAVYNFWLYDLCDHFLELMKPIMRAEADSTPEQKACALAVLYTCLDHGLRLLHPLMPFISEELYHRLPGALDTPEAQAGTGGRAKCGSIMVAAYPKPSHTSLFHDPASDVSIELVKQIAHSARSTRSSLNLTKKRVDMFVVCAREDIYEDVKRYTRDIATLSIANSVTAVANTDDAKSTIPKGCLTNIVSPLIEMHIPLAGLVDVGAEVVKMEKNAERLQAMIRNMQEKISAPGYEKSSEEVRNKNNENLSSNQEELSKLQKSIDDFKSAMTPEQLASYTNDKLNALQNELDKHSKSIDKLRSGLPADPKAHPKKTLAKIADAEAEVEKIQQKIQAIKLNQ